MPLDIDSLTIGEAKRLAFLFGGLSVAPSPSPLAPLVGKVALVRSRGSGVWAGVVESAHEGVAGHTLTLSSARRFWSWTGAGECSSLASIGPSGGKIGPMCSPIVAEVLEAHAMSATAVSELAKVAPWTK